MPEEFLLNPLIFTPFISKPDADQDDSEDFADEIEHSTDEIEHSTDEIEDCDEKTKICKCQNQESKNENNTKLGTLIKYYKNDQLHCFQSSGNHQSCFLFQDEDGKFAYIIPSKYNLNLDLNYI